MGRGVETKSSRIFQQCYVKCCKLQNLTPLNNVIPSGNGSVLDFCVDRIKYVDWPPILNALSCDLSLHTVAIKCRQNVKTVLEHIDCERLAKTVNKRCVMLTNFMLSNLVEAISQILTNSTLLTSLTLEGLPLRIPYLNPLCQALSTNNCLQHLYLPRSLIGDAGCVAICKAIRCLPNVLTLDLSGCELTPAGATHITDLIKYQKIHRYSENWVHTLRYRLPELDSMAGLRRITLCGNPMLGDIGVASLLEVLADDLWIKALDVQNCGLTEATSSAALHTLNSNTTLVVLDLRNNPEINTESLSKLRMALRNNERGLTGQFSWLSSVSSGSSDRLAKSNLPANKNGLTRERTSSNMRSAATRNTKVKVVKKEKEYMELLEEQLQEETSHRQQLEELNLQLVHQMRELKQQQIRLWNCPTSSGSEQSLQASSPSGELSSSSGSSSSVPIDQSTLSYIQQAFKDIYTFIKNNQCYGKCVHESPQAVAPDLAEVSRPQEKPGHRRGGAPVRTHRHATKRGKVTKSAHLLGDTQTQETHAKLEMFEKHMGDTRSAHNEQLNALQEMVAAQLSTKKCSRSGSSHSGCSSVSSDTLVCDPAPDCTEQPPGINPLHALYSSSSSSSVCSDDDQDMP